MRRLVFLIVVLLLFVSGCAVRYDSEKVYLFTFGMTALVLADRHLEAPLPGETIDEAGLQQIEESDGTEPRN